MKLQPRFVAGMLKVVLETVVLVRALINPHSACGRLVFQYFDQYRLFVSQPVLKEMLEVLRRPELTRKFRTLDRLDLTRAIEILGEAEVAELGELTPVSRDPNDDMFLATAKAAGADYLVTEDQDLLVLGTYEKTQIVSSAAFLALLA